MDQATQQWADGGFAAFLRALQIVEPGMPPDYYDIKARQLIIWAAVNGYRLESVLRAHVDQLTGGPE